MLCHSDQGYVNKKLVQVTVILTNTDKYSFEQEQSKSECEQGHCESGEKIFRESRTSEHEKYDFKLRNYALD